LNCKNAALYEEYSGSSKKIVFDGCWKNKSVKTPVDRETCDNFEEDPERMKRSFWKKWEGCIYIAAGGPGDQDLHINYDAFETARDLLGKREETEVPGSPLTSEQVEEHGLEVHAPLHICELPDRTVEIPEKTTGKTITKKPGSTIAGSDQTVEIPEKTAEQAAAEENESTREHESTTKPRSGTTTHPEKTSTTRSLVLQALANKISKLSDIAFFAGVDPSTVHYHLRNLVREQRVVKTGWGHYILSGDQYTDGNFFENDGRTFEKLLKNFSHPGRGRTGADKLHPVEKNILMDILSKENKYEQFSERELARRNNISRYSAKKYTLNLEKKKLITIKEENNQLVFTPTTIAINGLTSFFDSQKSGSKIESSKVQPVDIPEDSKVQPVNTPGYLPADPGPLPDQPGGIMETFDEYVAWQQKNAHRLIIQFKLLKCDHNRLKKTGWVFDKKRIHRHFTEAYIFKSKDPSGEFINVLPKHPFIFTSPFEFEDQIIAFIN
jgi:DNA-binding MarR family transcriptional regulator